MDPQYCILVDGPSGNTGKEMRRVLCKYQQKEEVSDSKQKYIK
jgi:hypothetical protein